MLISWEVQQETLSSMKLWIMLTDENVELTRGTISSPPPCYQGEGCAIKTHVGRCINSSIKARPPPSSLPIGRTQRGAIWLVESRPRSAIDRRWIKTTILDKLRSSCDKNIRENTFVHHQKALPGLCCYILASRTLSSLQYFTLILKWLFQFIPQTASTHQRSYCPKHCTEKLRFG